MKNSLKKALSSLVVITILVVLLSVPATATTGNWFNGAWKTVNNNGAALTIETQNPTVSNDVSIWAMTTNGTTSYAQVGWAKHVGYTSSMFFYEYYYSPTNTWYQKDFGTATAGTHNDYMVGCDSTTMYFKINSTEYGTCALTTIPFSRTMVQFFAEVHDDTGDQCPGSATNPVTAGNAQYKNTSNTWVSTAADNPCSQGYGDLSTMRNNIATGGSKTWEVWDSRY